MNLAQEFKNILKEYGRDVLVIRQDRKLRCSCFNEVTQEASRRCTTCFGLGWSFVAERHTVRSEDVSSGSMLTRVVGTSEIGIISDAGKKYYALPNMKVNQDDLIVEVKWDRFGRPVYENGGIWSISSTNIADLGDGKEICQTVYVSEKPVLSRVRSININEVNGIKQYQIAMEAK